MEIEVQAITQPSFVNFGAFPKVTFPLGWEDEVSPFNVSCGVLVPDSEGASEFISPKELISSPALSPLRADPDLYLISMLAS